MPTPKAPTPILVGVRATVPAAVGFQTLLPFIQKKKDAPPEADIEKYEEIIRDAVGFYVGSVHATPVITMTQRRSKLTGINTAVKRLLKAIKTKNREKSIKWNDELFERWTSLDANTRAVIYRHFDNALEDSSTIKNELKMYPSKLHSERFIALLKTVLEVNHDLALVVKPSVNPMLARLLQSLAPIWLDVTGYTLRLGSKSSVQENPFAMWVQRLLRAAGVPAPSAETIIGTARKLSENLK